MYLLVGSLGSVAVGALVDAGHFDGAFLFLGGCTLLGALLCFHLSTVEALPND